MSVSRVNRSLNAVCCATQGARVCERGQVVRSSAVPRESLCEQRRGPGISQEAASTHPEAGRSDVDGHRRQRGAQPGSGSRSLGRSSSPVATRHSSTLSALLGPGLRRTHPFPAAQVPPAPPSSPFARRPTGNDDRGAAVRGGAQRERGSPGRERGRYREKELRS
ncbi:uncharacterized protein RBU33_001917 [Hipposideros larvatus]